MIRNDKPTPNRPVTYTVYLNRGGMGDHLARLVPIRWILDTYPFVSIQLITPDYLAPLAGACFKENARLTLIKESELVEGEMYAPSTLAELPEACTNMRMHTVDHAFIMIADHLPTERKAREYIQLSPQPGSSRFPGVKYVVLTTNFTAKVREWPAPEIEATIIGLIKRGYTPVLLGKKDVSDKITGYSAQLLDTTGAIDLRDTTTLEEAHSIMYYAEAVLGVDNGLIHLAGMTSTPIIAGYTTVNPAHRIPIRPRGEIRVIGPRVDCRYCQTNMNFVYHQDFRQCIYGDYACTTEMTAERFLAEFDKLELDAP